MEEGINTKGTGGYTYEYALKDHLGNVRISFSKGASGPAINQRTDYYPFGMTFSNQFSSSTGNDYLYNGKESQKDIAGLDWYDYGWRMYDAQIGRWHVIDPMIEMHKEYTPYAYVYNNPIKLIDPNGCDSLLNTLTDMAKKYNFRLTVDGEVKNEGSKKSDEKDEQENSTYNTFTTVSDQGNWLGNAKDGGELAAEYTGMKLGYSAGKGAALYGASFFGNKYTRIIKLKNPVKVGGVMVNSIIVVADLGAFANASTNGGRQQAMDNLYKDLVFIGISAANAEVGVLLTVGDYLMNTPEMQQFRQELQVKREQAQFILHPPSGQLYFNQGKK